MNSYVEDKKDDSNSGGGSGGQENETLEKLKFIDKTGFGISAGLDANINVFYPVKLTVGVYYDQLLFGGKTWDDVMDVLDKVGTKRSGLTFRAGLIYEF
jgi:opacity protein-like surface antigen